MEKFFPNYFPPPPPPNYLPNTKNSLGTPVRRSIIPPLILMLSSSREPPPSCPFPLLRQRNNSLLLFPFFLDDRNKFTPSPSLLSFANQDCSFFPLSPPLSSPSALRHAPPFWHPRSSAYYVPSLFRHSLFFFL